MSNLIGKLFEILTASLVVSFAFFALAIVYKEVLKPEPPVECRNGKLFEVTTRDNIIVYEPTFDDCEVKH